jgi:hypothetical protein
MLLDRSVLEAGGFYNFQKLLLLFINVNRNVTLQRKGMKIATF